MKPSTFWIKAALPILIIIVVVLLAALLVMTREPPKQEPVEQKPMLVEVLTASFKPHRFQIKSQGVLLPKHQGGLSSEVAGRVVSLADTFEAGGFIRKGDLLVQLDEQDYQTGVQSAEAALYAAKASLEEERARAKVAEKEWQQFKAEQTPELGLRKPQLARELANLKSAQARLEQAKRNLERTRIRAPYDALIEARMVEVGEYVAPGATVAKLMGTALAEIRLPIREAELEWLKPDGSSEALLSHERGGSKLNWSARLVRSEGVLDLKSRFSHVVAQLIDPYGLDSDKPPLRFGTFIQASMESAVEFMSVKLPRSALRGGDQLVLVNEANQILLRTIQIEYSEGDDVFVRQNIEEGERVVLTPVLALPKGSEVRIKAAGD